MSADYAHQISEWKYEKEYSIYSFQQDDDTMKELMNGDYFAYLDRCNDLSGYFCFGKSARIPAVEEGAYESEMLDIGLGMKPALCGKGFGCAFVKSGLDFAQSSFGIDRIRLTVAGFNTRAIRVYERIGFQPVSSVTHRKTLQIFRVMIYAY
jgi:RimJ/RimL family protein N-acetyltransferase